MTRMTITVALACAALAGCANTVSQIPTQPRTERVAVAEMPQACRRAAANRYAQLPGNLQVQPAVRDTSGGYSVTGSYATVNQQRTFGCRFTAGGEFMGLGRV